MAYGRIKADTLVFDNSGSDVELTISTIALAGSLSNYAPLAGATFTGGIAGTTANFTGKVGINQSSPTAFMHAKSGANDGTVIGTFEGATNNKLDIKFISTGPALNVTAGDPLVFEIGGSQKMQIDSSGRLLVGTTTEGYPFADTLTIAESGNSGITIRSGTTSSGAVYFSDATSGTGEYDGWVDYSHNNRTMHFGVAANERMRIDSSGNVFIGGTTASSADIALNANGSASFKAPSGNGVVVQTAGGNEGSKFPFVGKNTSGTSTFSVNGDGAATFAGAVNLALLRVVTSGTTYPRIIGTPDGTLYSESSSGVYPWQLLPAGSATFAGNAKAVAAAGAAGGYRHSQTDGGYYLQDDAGNSSIVLYKAGNATFSKVDAVFNSSVDVGLNLRNSSAGTSARFYSGSSIVGSITVTGSATAYNTSSDYRLKENVVDIADGITRVKQLQPKRFNFIADADTTVDGFLAHEAQTVVPEAITGEKDATKEEKYVVTPAVEEIVDEDGNVTTAAVDAVMGTRTVPDHQGIDQSKLVPLLTAALQEAIGEIEILKTKVAALEAG